MCLACNVTVDAEKRDAFAEHFLAMLNGGVAMLMVSIGHRSGLFDAMADGAERTSTQLAEETGLNERYVREWLGAMVTARIVERDARSQTHRLPPEHAHWLSRKQSKDNMAVFSQYVSVLGGVEDRVLECFRNGGGVPYEAYPRFHDVMAEDSGQSIVPIVVDELVPLVDGLHERLQQGIDVLDIGCGRGLALNQLAAAYPNSRFTGYDLSGEAIAYAGKKANTAGLANVTFERRDLTDWAEPSRFDWITAFDAIHDQARPDKVLAGISLSLRPDGLFLMQDIDLSSEPAENIDHPLGAVLYGVSCLHCMTVSLAQGGMGLGAAWGRQTAERMLRDVGFARIDRHRFEHDIQNVYFVCRK